ncbi:unnamed protein product [Polarella glacialis]|uniref:Uncharacterized protein n=1 Tax=Polarella glacialis TaxID=89957 RepID=A0A813DWW8_POLGL|nr:unnamed protein product [Polarella glacialis]
MQVIAKEDQMRWDSQDKMQEMRNITGEQRAVVKLPRAHSCLGPFPGCRRLAPLSPRKSAAINFLEQKLCRSDSMPSMPTAHDRLYDGVSKEDGSSVACTSFVVVVVVVSVFFSIPVVKKRLSAHTCGSAGRTKKVGA